MALALTPERQSELVGFGELYGPLPIGMMIGCFLFGTTLSQAIIYFKRCHKDSVLVRSIVWSSLILDAIQSAMVAEVAHFWYIVCRRPENYLGLLEFRWSLGASLIATCCAWTIYFESPCIE